ncbi:PAS domain S-box-containing protein/diguanylate cyclase (GGDEF) domain-containing protein [Humidesulfovibrio mexicanus]|uniref:PAS domain S-box-containing protein/diguanylate cyclase (GGDEF) domain-containing protein n=1 Tax=Humidesulfovibrio mexicanus TaxID=147047 RepID=A0A239ARM6_9BACT|nr:sensor domain-containing diguanylate cyclase [Humidesulfovibrio mexicanus]SNR98180.1 PAS domain S-box-containing protein/diguanylate cyclase (GGDEF) domain-containing protein [Humidesulfovibrio mexicanus]
MSWSVRKSLVARLVSTYMVLSVLVVLCAGAASWLAARELLREAVFERLETSSRQKETELALWVEERRADLLFLCSLAAREGEGGAGRGFFRVGPQLRRLLLDYAQAKPDVHEALLLAPTGGKVLLSTNPASEGSYRASYSFYIQGRQRLSMQNVYPSPESLRPVVTVSAPVKDDHGRLLAVLALHLNLDPISQIIRSRAGLGETGETFLVDSSSLLVASGRMDMESARRKTHSQGVAQALAGSNGRGQYENDAGVQVLGAYRWLPAYQMAMLAEMSQAEAFAPAGRLAVTLVLVALGATVLLAVGVYVLSRRLARPILDVTRAAMGVAGGDLSVRAEVETADELGNLARAFNAMTGELSALYDRLEQEGRERGAILQGSFDGIAVVRGNGAVEYCNPGMERLLGCSLEDTPSLGVLADRIFHQPEERRAFVASLEADMRKENPPERVFAFQHVSGARRWCRLKVSPMGGDRLVLNAQDLTEIKASEERVRHMALHDHLTGLPNRQLFLDRLDQALRRAKRGGASVALLYLDLDQFKSLNDAYGHAHGDRVLVETALRLRACVRESDTVARLGGDEFVVVLPDLLHAEDALSVAEKIRECLYDPEADGGRLFLGASVGVACFPLHGHDQDSLLARADAAMYEAKRAGGNAVRVAPLPPLQVGAGVD